MTPWDIFFSTRPFPMTPLTLDQDPQIDATLRLVPLSGHRLLNISGKDAFRFLQGQVTCDIEAVAAGQWQLGAHCNPKGRMISSFLVAAQGPESLLLRVRDDLGDTARAALHKYIVFSKAKIEVSDRVALALLGPVHSTSLPFPLPAVGQWHSDADMTIVRRGVQWSEIWVVPEQLPRLFSELADIATGGAPEWFELCQIREGIAEVTRTTSETFIPQMFNYQLVGGVNFRKGCYTGQEIVARMQYRGQLKKHLYRIAVPSENPILIGTELLQQDRPIGSVVASVHDGQNAEMLAVCVAEHVGQSTGLASHPTEIQWLDLPYAIP